MPSQTELHHHAVLPIRQFDTRPLDVAPDATHSVERRPASSERVTGVFRGFVFGVVPSLALWAGIAWLIGAIR